MPRSIIKENHGPHKIITYRKNAMCSLNGTEKTCVEIATEMKEYFRMKDMLNANVL